MLAFVLCVDGDVVSMLTFVRFRKAECPANHSGGFKQIRIILHPPDRPAHRGSIHLKPSGHLTSGEGQIPGGNMADHSTSLCHLVTLCTAQQFLMFNPKMTANGCEYGDVGSLLSNKSTSDVPLSQFKIKARIFTFWGLHVRNSHPTLHETPEI